MKIPQTKQYSIYKNLVLQDKRSEKLNFEPDGREHYVYRVTDYTRTSEEHYYGSRTPKKGKVYSNLIDEFWTYKTSSNYNYINENSKENYKIKIIKVLNNPADKMIYEAFLHQYFDTKISNSFWNKSNQTPFGFDTTGKSFNIGRRCSASTKLAISLSNSGMIVVYDGENIIRIPNNDKNYLDGKYKNLTQDKVAVRDNKGNKFSVSCEEYKSNDELFYIIDQTIVYDKITGKNKIVTPEEFQNNEHYEGIAKNKVNVKDKRGNKFQVNLTDERYLSGELVHVKKGLKYDKNSKEYKKAYIDRDVSGSKNSQALKIHIYDNFNNLRYECFGNIRDIIKENNLSGNLIDSYRNNGKSLYETNRQLSFAKKKGWESFQGWYAKIID